MAIYVYISDQCRRDATPQNYVSQLDRLAERIEQEQHLGILDRFPPPFLKKRFERQIRLVAKEFRVGTDILVIFLRLIIRGDRQYIAFCESGFKNLPGVNLDGDEFSLASLEQILESRRTIAIQEVPRPSETEHTFLHSSMAQNVNMYHDYHVCETAEWADMIKDYTHVLAQFPEKILECIGEDAERVVYKSIRAQDNPGFLARVVPSNKQVFLLYPFDDRKQEVLESEWKGILDAESPVDAGQAIRYAKRAYPFDLIFDNRAWSGVQQESEGNMALSHEELSVLQSVRENGDSGGFPLFINGRAGSGKSTVLQYLFSEFVKSASTPDSSVHPPAYFACNRDLIERARENVEIVLKANNQNRSTTLKNRGSFHEFYQYLLELCPTAMQNKGIFLYSHFQEWWSRTFAKDRDLSKELSGDLAWHVIRTYIKGLYADQEFEPGDYVDIPLNQKSVSERSLRLVYDKIYPKYKERLEETGFWDHQDIAQYVIENGLAKPAFSAVFCDEAQDFTRLELEILHGLCIYSQRRLFDHELRKVPYAFAGDPFQTLNPTGFRWDATKTFFVEKFGLMPGGTSLFNYKELSFNYRSHPGIVKFCNSLQLVRSNIFRLPEVTPQEAWSSASDSPQIPYFEWEDESTKSSLKSQGEIRIIVPCNEGEEEEYVKTSGLISIVKCDEMGVPKNVVSATRVKGLEFPRVVLFGFGAKCPQSLLAALTKSDALLLDDGAIEPQYFYNKLYVGASRPRKRLFIVDSKRAFSDFWLPLFSEEQSRPRWTKEGQPDAWLKHTGAIRQGRRDDWEAEKENSLETAQALLREGLARSDRILLRQAAQSFEAAHCLDDAKGALAKAYSIEGRNLEAGRLLDELGRSQEALLEFWKAGPDGQQPIISLGERYSDISTRLEYMLVKFVRSDQTMISTMNLLHQCLQRLQNNHNELSLAFFEPLWMKSFSECLDRILAIEGGEGTHWRVVGGHLRDLDKLGLYIPRTILGITAYRAGDYYAALSDWNNLSADEVSRVEFSLVRSRILVGDPHESIDAALTACEKYRGSQILSEAFERFSTDDVFLKSRNAGTVLRTGLLAGETARLGPFIGLCQDCGVLAEILTALLNVDAATFSQVLGRFWKLIVESGDSRAIREWGTDYRYDSSKSIQGYSDWAKQHPSLHYEPFVDICNDSKVTLNLHKGDKRDLAQSLSVAVKRVVRGGRVTEAERWLHALHVVGFNQISLETCKWIEDNFASNVSLGRLALDWWIQAKRAEAERLSAAGDQKAADSALKEAAEAKERDQIRKGLLTQEQGDEPIKHAVLSEPELKSGESSTQVPQIPDKSITSRLPSAGSIGKSSKKYSVDATLYKSNRILGLWSIKVSPDGTRVNFESVTDYKQGSYLPAENRFVFEGISYQEDSPGIFRLFDPFLQFDVTGRWEGKIEVRSEGDLVQVFRTKKVMRPPHVEPT